jgi:glycosyltransferase involved in cell wall biosynthesis
MRCPRLNELPPPPPDKRGWPWTEESQAISDPIDDGTSWPRITVITPSFNQGQFLEATIRSVLLQGYPDLEYIVLDAASKDNSIEIIKKYAPWLSYWVSEPDGGQSAAINHGLKMGSGLLASWINSDDMLCQNAMVHHITRIGSSTDYVYVGDCIYIDAAGKTVARYRGKVHSFVDLLDLKNVWCAHGHIVQPEVLFPLQPALMAGGLSPTNHYTMDYELWGKLFLTGARFQYTEIPFGMFRRHQAQKTHDKWARTQSLVAAAKQLVMMANEFSAVRRNTLLADLMAYQDEYWKRTGLLARLGLPPYVVQYLRALRFRIHLRTRIREVFSQTVEGNRKAK